MRGVNVTDLDKGEVTLPNSEEVVAPKPLVKTDLVTARGTRRQQLTLWLTTRDNPFLARATVNRVWAMFMGRGLVEPIDDMRAEHPASHPELLDELSAYFTDSGYDLQKLILAITQTQAYGRSTQHASGSYPEELYASMLAKPLTERQIANSVSEVARQLGSQSQVTQQQLARQLGKLRGEASQSKLGIVSALVTLHGDLLDQASNEKSSRLLRALQAPHLDHQGQIRWMFLTVLCRTPNQNEQQRIYNLIETLNTEANPPPKSEAAVNAQEIAKAADLQWQSDLLWALLNSSEFAMVP